MDEHPYIVNPFAGIICKSCNYGIKCKLFSEEDIYRHETGNKNHKATVGLRERRVVIADQMRRHTQEIAETIANLTITDEVLARAELSKYLCVPSKMYTYCSECQQIIAKKNNHMNRTHLKYCKSTVQGFTLNYWEKIRQK